MKSIFRNFCYLICGPIIFFSALAQAQTLPPTLHRPPQFVARGLNDKVTFIDIQKAQHRIVYDVASKKTKYQSTIDFISFEKGLPVLDVINNPTYVALDNKIISTSVVNSPDQITKFRVLHPSVNPGRHRAVLQGFITKTTVYKADGVSSGFYPYDLADRSYLEAYLPSNFEYDAHGTIYSIEIRNTSREHLVFSNAPVAKIGRNHFQLTAPSRFNASSIFVKIIPKNSAKTLTSEYTTLSGRRIPITLIKEAGDSNDLNEGLRLALSTLKKGENVYGEWRHPALLIWMTGTGAVGMEYAGATWSTMGALVHEIYHGWYGRGVIPANGNANWIDEGITTWATRGFAKKSTLNGRSNMAGGSPYSRMMNGLPYRFGADFIAHLYFKYDERFIGFLRWFYKYYSFKPITTEFFVEKMSEYLKEDVSPLFKKFVY